MRIATYRIRELPTAYWPVWATIQESYPEFESPFFCPEFAKLVSSVRADAEVGVLLQSDQPVGFFPFHRGIFGVGIPLAGHLSDFQAVIAYPGVQWTPNEVIRGCGLAGWDFDHLLSTVKEFDPFVTNESGSPYIDLSNGFQEYEKVQKQKGATTIARINKMKSKLAKDVGPVRLDVHRPDQDIFEQLIKLKKWQFKQTGVKDALSNNWTVELLKKIMCADSANFAGVLSVLSAGDRVIAMHLGMRSRTVWHLWFTSYDQALSQYSPGMMMHLEMARAAEAHKLTRIDLGKGDSDYKRRLATGAITVREGAVIVSDTVRWARRGWHATKTCLRGALRPPVRWVRKWMKRAGSA